jgi:hypothetical protein
MKTIAIVKPTTSMNSADVMAAALTLLKPSPVVRVNPPRGLGLASSTSGATKPNVVTLAAIASSHHSAHTITPGSANDRLARQTGRYDATSRSCAPRPTSSPNGRTTTSASMRSSPRLGG